jgi:hypothetical protein
MSDIEQSKKTARSVTSQATTTNRQTNVFDTAGNDAIKSKIAEVEAETGAASSAQSKQSLLDKVAKNAETAKQGAPDAASATDVGLKQTAVAARDEVILQVQMLTSNAETLEQLQNCDSVFQASTLAVELVAQNVADEDMAALAAYGHHDLMQGKILSPESHLETRGVSAQARKMGGFVPILWQLVADQFIRSDVKLAGGGGGETAVVQMGSAGAAAPNDPRALAAPLLRAAGVLSAARSSSIV